MNQHHKCTFSNAPSWPEGALFFRHSAAVMDASSPKSCCDLAALPMILIGYKLSVSLVAMSPSGTAEPKSPSHQRRCSSTKTFSVCRVGDHTRGEGITVTTNEGTEP